MFVKTTTKRGNKITADLKRGTVFYHGSNEESSNYFLCDGIVKALGINPFKVEEIRVSVASYNPKEKGWRKIQILSGCDKDANYPIKFNPLNRSTPEIVSAGCQRRWLTGLGFGKTFWMKIDKTPPLPEEIIDPILSVTMRQGPSVDSQIFYYSDSYIGGINPQFICGEAVRFLLGSTPEGITVSVSKVPRSASWRQVEIVNSTEVRIGTRLFWMDTQQRAVLLKNKIIDQNRNHRTFWLEIKPE